MNFILPVFLSFITILVGVILIAYVISKFDFNDISNLFYKASDHNYPELHNLSISTIEHKLLVKKIANSFKKYLEHKKIHNPNYSKQFSLFIFTVLSDKKYNLVNYKGTFPQKLTSTLDLIKFSYSKIDEYNTLQENTKNPKPFKREPFIKNFIKTIKNT